MRLKQITITNSLSRETPQTTSLLTCGFYVDYKKKVSLDIIRYIVYSIYDLVKIIRQENKKQNIMNTKTLKLLQGILGIAPVVPIFWIVLHYRIDMIMGLITLLLYLATLINIVSHIVCDELKGKLLTIGSLILGLFITAEVVVTYLDGIQTITQKHTVVLGVAIVLGIIIGLIIARLRCLHQEDLEYGYGVKL